MRDSSDSGSLLDRSPVPDDQHEPEDPVHDLPPEEEEAAAEHEEHGAGVEEGAQPHPGIRGSLQKVFRGVMEQFTKAPSRGPGGHSYLGQASQSPHTHLTLASYSPATRRARPEHGLGKPTPTLFSSERSNPARTAAFQSTDQSSPISWLQAPGSRRSWLVAPDSLAALSGSTAPLPGSPAAP